MGKRCRVSRATPFRYPRLEAASFLLTYTSELAKLKLFDKSKFKNHQILKGACHANTTPFSKLWWCWAPGPYL